MTPATRLVVGLVAAIVAGACLGLAYQWFLWSDVAEHNRPGWAAARGALWYAVAFGVSGVVRRLLRAGWFVLVPVTALVGAVLYDGATLGWDGGAAWVIGRVVAYWLVSLPVMTGVVVLARVATARPRPRATP